MSGATGILAVGLSPAIQRSLLFDRFEIGEVNRSSGYYTDAAGKCVNVARVLTQAGCSSTCLTIAGRENRREFERLCRRDGMHLITTEVSGRVRTCTTVIDRSTGLCTELVVNEPESVTPEEEQAFTSEFLRELEKRPAVLVISGSRLPGFSQRIIPFMVEQAKGQGMMVIADYRGKDLLDSFQTQQIRPDYVKINYQEFLETFDSFDDMDQAIDELSRTYDCAFILSRGKDPTLVVEHGLRQEIASERRQAVNPIGCGDSMTAGVAHGLLDGASLQEAVALGIAYAAKNVMSVHPGWIL
jgi:tagatose 6-phosphate kinase